MLQPAITVQAIRSPGFVSPAVPDGVGASRIADTTIRVSWDAAFAATSYKVWQATSAGGPYSGAGTTSDLSLDDSGLSNSTKYYYKVSAINAKGESDKSSDTASATTAASGGGGGGGGGDPATAPNAPSDCAASTTGATTQTVTWTDNSSDEDQFNVYRDGTKVATVAADSTSYNATGLTEGTSYAWKVSAENTAGESGFSNEVSATTKLAAPTNLTGETSDFGFVTLNWTENSSKESEVVLLKDGVIVQTLDADAESTAVTQSGTYKVQARASSIPNSDFSNSITVTESDLSSDSGKTLV